MGQGETWRAPGLDDTYLANSYSRLSGSILKDIGRMNEKVVRDILLVGSVPLRPASKVFSAVARASTETIGDVLDLHRTVAEL